MKRKSITTVRSSNDFRDAVFGLARDQLEVFVSRPGGIKPVYRVIYGTGLSNITLDQFFGDGCPPVHMEDFATALIPFGPEAPPMEVFTASDVT